MRSIQREINSDVTLCKGNSSKEAQVWLSLSTGLALFHLLTSLLFQHSDLVKEILLLALGEGKGL